MHIQKTGQQHVAVRIATSHDGAEIGHAYLYLIKNDLHDRPYGYLEDVFVVESYRGQGVGTELVQAAIVEARARGCYKIVGTSRMEREDVHAWYEKLGLKKYGIEFRMNLSESSKKSV